MASLPPRLTGNAIRKAFIDYFLERGHTFVPSASLVPGGDSTLLFTNSGMVQFKDVFLGTDKRPYTRAANSQKSMRVAGKHNDLDDVGRDDTHHTFFEMLGNWSFGDYYKKEAIAWAWNLLTEVWGLPKDRLFATVFEDEYGQIPADEEAASHWLAQPGFDPAHLFYLGRKDNFWEMADTGPCGPCSEIHIDLRPQEGGPITAETLDTGRFVELWNLVFIQYNRTDETTFKPLPATHVDTGMGFERIVSVLQGVSSTYRTDLLWPLILKTQELTGHTDAQREANFTPYRVVADHARAAAFLIADGVIPGNLGRNYVTRMIIRRAYRFGGKIGLTEPFLAPIAEIVIQNYGDHYPELVENRSAILTAIPREEEQFQRTLDRGTAQLNTLLDALEASGQTTLPGEQAADLYTTCGMPLEITRDIARERGLEVNQKGFDAAMDAHRLASNAGTAMGKLGPANPETYAAILADLQTKGGLGPEGVSYDPYTRVETRGGVLALLVNATPVESASPGDPVEVILPETCFYLESGGQVDDTGTISSLTPQPPFPPNPSVLLRTSFGGKPLPQDWGPGGELGAGGRGPGGELGAGGRGPGGELGAGGRGPGGELGAGGGRRAEGWAIQITSMRRPAAGVIVHVGKVISGHPRVGDQALAQIDAARRRDIMRNHTATHLLHAALHHVLGDRARQAGSLVAPGRLRFDFTHPEAVTPAQLRQIEDYVNEKILANYPLQTTAKPLQQAKAEGATALFGEKYGETVRTIRIGDFSYELCGGTHCPATSFIGLFLVTSEGSAAAGIRRIEAITGREAARHALRHRDQLRQVAAALDGTPDTALEKTTAALEALRAAQKESAALRQQITNTQFTNYLTNPHTLQGITLVTAHLPGTDTDTLRAMADQFRQRYPENGVAVLASAEEGKVTLIAAVTKDLNARGLKAGDLAGFVARQLGGGGGGSPTLAQAGGKDASKLEDALASVEAWVKTHAKP